MIRTTQNGLTLFQFSNLSACPNLAQAVFSRLGGSSQPPFDGLNMSAGEGDNEKMVSRNRTRVAACFGNKPLVFLHQVHQDNIIVFKKKSTAPDPSIQHQGDAMITDIPGLMLAIKLADCQGIILYDPDRQVTAAVHCGWRGSVADIIGKTIRRMTADFGCDPADILAGVSPSLGPCCAEFINYRSELPEPFWKHKDNRDHFDFWRISRDQMTAAGLAEKNIEIAGICTGCRTDIFYSYRKEGRTGRFVAVAGMV